MREQESRNMKIVKQMSEVLTERRAREKQTWSENANEEYVVLFETFKKYNLLIDK